MYCKPYSEQLLTIADVNNTRRYDSEVFQYLLTRWWMVGLDENSVLLILARGHRAILLVEPCWSCIQVTRAHNCLCICLQLKYQTSIQSIWIFILNTRVTLPVGVCVQNMHQTAKSGLLWTASQWSVWCKVEKIRLSISFSLSGFYTWL